MSALGISQSVVSGQQKYAKEHSLSTLFEVLTISLLSNKPKDALGFLHTQLSEMVQSGGEAKLPPVSIFNESSSTEKKNNEKANKNNGILGSLLGR